MASTLASFAILLKDLADIAAVPPAINELADAVPEILAHPPDFLREGDVAAGDADAIGRP